MSSFTIKPLPSVKELKILLLKISFGVLFVVFGIFGVFNDVFGATIFEDDFETYPVGSLEGQGGWVQIAGDNWYITTDDALSGQKSIYTPVSSIGSIYKKIGTPQTEGRIVFYVKTTDIATQKDILYVYLRGLYDESEREFAYFVFQYGVVKWASQGQSLIQIGTISSDTWYSAEMEWNSITHLVRMRWNEGTWTDWKTMAWGIPDRLRINYGYISPGTDRYWLDYIAENLWEPSCDLEHCSLCENWFDCQVVGCCWYYQPWYPPPLDNYCDVCEGECSYPYNCGLCETETTCEVAGCFWTGDYCTQFEWECGPELACQFCLNQTTCEAEGCNWSTISETCWYAVPTLPSSWSAYYDTHGGYETPAEFVNQLAATTGETFDVVSGLFEGFMTSFNTADALAKGSALGSVIPKGRGYLKVFDGLFGHYPIGETFVFILIFMLAIGLFRIARQLIQLIKP